MTTPPRGRILSREGGSFDILLDGGERVAAVLRGKARRGEDKAVAGDRVRLDAALDGVQAIAAVEPRRNQLERRTPEGRGVRVVAANVDEAFIVVAAKDPVPVPQLLDRFLAIASVNDIPVAVVVNKIELDPATALVERMGRAGYRVFSVSVKTGLGLDALFAEMRREVSLVAGPSGVGKSSLLNALQPGLRLRTGEVSDRARRGTHTTVAAVMVPLTGGGFLVDTPGFSEVGIWGVEPRELARCFPDIEPFVGECRFQDCMHTKEPGCAVRHAVASGALQADRLESYLVLLQELTSGPRDWE